MEHWQSLVDKHFDDLIEVLKSVSHQVASDFAHYHIGGEALKCWRILDEVKTHNTSEVFDMLHRSFQEY